MRRPSRIVIPLLLLLVVVVWSLRDEPPPVSPPSPPPAPNSTTKTSPAAPTLLALDDTAADMGQKRRAPPATTSRLAGTSPTDDAALPPARLQWDGPASVRAGSLFAVTLRLTSDVPVHVVPMQLRFDPEILELVSVRAGAYFGDAAHFGYHVNQPGSIRIGATADTPTPAADAELIVVTFRPIRQGTVAELRISTLELEAPAGPVVYEGIAPFTTTITR